jgi:hypothetical protein
MKSSRPFGLSLSKAVACLVLLAVAGCKRSPPPDEAYRAFARAVREGDPQTAWDALSSGSQQQLDRLVKEAAQQAPGVVTPDPREQVLGNAARGARHLKSVEVLRVEGDRAVLKVEEEGGPGGEVTLVREKGRWKVTLPGV